MDDMSSGNLESTDVFPAEIDFLRTDENAKTGLLDPHSILEMRISELWKKLEETSSNLNSCDTMLETYCETVAEKLKEKRCPNCLNISTMDEAMNNHSNKDLTSISWPPNTLIEGISSSLQKVEKAIINGTSFILTPELDFVDETVHQQRVIGEKKFPIGVLCKILQEVLFKMKSLEASLEASSKTECVTVGEHSIEEKVEISHVRKTKAISQTFENAEKQQESEKGTCSSTHKDVFEASPANMSCVILSLAVCALATEDKENEKQQQKRGIIGLGYGSGYSGLGGFGYSGLGDAGLIYSGLGHSGLGISGLGYSSLGLSGIGYGRSYGYAAAAPIAVAAAPVARTVLASAPLVSRVSLPIHAPVAAAPIAAAQIRAHPIAVAAPITAHVAAAPIAAHAPVAAFAAHVAAPIATHQIAAPVHLAAPITARIAAPIAAPIAAINLGYGGARLGHGRPLLH